MKLEYTVTEDEIMVKEYLKLLKFSRKYGKKVKLYGKIIVNGVEVKNYYILHKNDLLVIELDEQENEEIVSTNIDLDIVYEDEYLLIINKPTNLACQPSKKHYEDNLASAIKNYYQNHGITSNIHLVNRLDYGTSGLMMVAKTGFIHQQMQNQVHRTYLCKTHGIFAEKEGKVDIGIKRSNEISILRETSPDGQRAITYYKVIKENIKENYSIVQCILDTGRTHQIRLHMKYLGHPIYGDKLYGVEDFEEILYLHSTIIKFYHPIYKKELEFQEIPKWFEGGENA